MQSVSLRSLRRIRWGVRLVLALGIAASVIANVLHAQPHAVAQTIAAWPPLALLLTVELIARVPVSRVALAAVRILATAAISGIAAWVSYWHMVGVAQRYGETGAAPYLIPLSVDGLVVVASVCLVELAARIRDAMAPAEEPAESVNPSPPEDESSQASPSEDGGQSDTPDEAEERAERDRRWRAFFLLAEGKDVDTAAAEAGVNRRSLQRLADQLAAATRKPRGGPRKATTSDAEKAALAEQLDIPEKRLDSILDAEPNPNLVGAPPA
ncbi:DUF2637 domain-containing protein [Virgisporangium aliadipatigenens]|nr:DUF2637 domain-containing protein [Virgisporangium aliadipatigenens]